MHTTDTEVWVSPPTDSPQWLIRRYHTPHGHIVTVATRQHIGEPWSPESEVYLVTGWSRPPVLPAAAATEGDTP